MNEMICRKCGFKSSPNMRFCQNCGDLLIDEENKKPHETLSADSSQKHIQRGIQHLQDDNKLRNLEKQMTTFLERLSDFSIELKEWRKTLAERFLEARTLKDRIDQLQARESKSIEHLEELERIEHNLDAIQRWFKEQATVVPQIEALSHSIRETNQILTDVIGYTTGIESDIRYSLGYVTRLKEEISQQKEALRILQSSSVSEDPILADKTIHSSSVSVNKEQDLRTKPLEASVFPAHPMRKKKPRQLRKGDRIVSFRLKSWLAELSLVYLLAFGGVLILAIGLFMGATFIYNEYLYSVIFSQEQTTATILRLLGVIFASYMILIISLGIFSIASLPEKKNSPLSVIAATVATLSTAMILFIIGLTTYGTSEGLVPLLFYLGLLPLFFLLIIGNQKPKSSLLSLLSIIVAIYYIVEATTSDSLLLWLNHNFDNTGSIINTLIILVFFAFYYFTIKRYNNWTPVFIFSVSLPLILLFAEEKVFVAEILLFLLPLLNLGLFSKNKVNAPLSFQHFMFSVSTLLSHIITLILFMNSKNISDLYVPLLIIEYSILLFGYYAVFWAYVNQYQLLEISLSIPVSIDLSSDQLIFRQIRTKINGIVVINNALVALGAFLLGSWYYAEISIIVSLLIAMSSAYLRIRRIDKSVPYGTAWNTILFVSSALPGLLRPTLLSYLLYLGAFVLFEAIFLSFDHSQLRREARLDLYLVVILGSIIFTNTLFILEASIATPLFPLFIVVLFHLCISILSHVSPSEKIANLSQFSGLILVLSVMFLISAREAEPGLLNNFLFNISIIFLFFNSMHFYFAAHNPNVSRTFWKLLRKSADLSLKIKGGGNPVTLFKQSLLNVVLASLVIVASWFTYFEGIGTVGNYLLTSEVIFTFLMFIVILNHIPSDLRKEMVIPLIALELSLLVGILTTLTSLSIFAGLSIPTLIDLLFFSPSLHPVSVLLISISWLLSIGTSMSLITGAKPLLASKSPSINNDNKNNSQSAFQVKEVSQ